MTVRQCSGIPGEPCVELIPASQRRCERHRLIAQRSPMHRSSAWQRTSHRMLRAHMIAHGPWCPGDAYHAAHVSWDLTIDHIVPLSRGGAEFDPSNLRVLCRGANTAAAHRKTVGRVG
jgi:5-methylcytosine-specific restriction endonuclease McrA